MSTKVTQGILITARANYEAQQSDPKAGRFLFSYRIRIENRGERPVKLLSRHWDIVDSLAARRVVEGAGVVGETPALAPGEQFAYTSFCDLRSGFGRMSGHYTMEDLENGHRFAVEIPAFELVHPVAAN